MLRLIWRTRWLVILLSLCLACLICPSALVMAKTTSPPVKVPSAEQLLTKHFRSESETTYTGIQVMTERTPTGSSTKVTRVYHKKPNKYRFEVDQLGESGNRIIIDDLRYRWTYEEKSSRATRDDSPSAGSDLIPWQKRKQLVEMNYVAVVEGTDKVAGRNVAILSLTPKRPIRTSTSGPVWRMWLDIETGLALKSEQFGLDGSLSRVMYFTEYLNQPDLADSLFKPKLAKGADVEILNRPKPIRDFEDLVNRLKIPLKLPRRLPLGFEYGWGYYARQGDKDVLRLWYTDGLATISIFQSFPPSGAKATSVTVGDTTSIYESSLESVDLTVFADMTADSLLGLLNDVLGPMISEEGVAASQYKSVQDRLRNVWRMLGLPTESTSPTRKGTE